MYREKNQPRETDRVRGKGRRLECESERERDKQIGNDQMIMEKSRGKNQGKN